MSDLLEPYDRELPRALGRVKALAPADLAEIVDFYGAFQLPNAAHISFVSAHGIPHRGQLSVDLRPMGSKVPSMYGGSADELWQPGA
ncbi:MAG TPA: DinB family protein [Thermoanaerobaculaceae bacterium]|mgnify:CR=1 FL=1|nr:DinB family protein [Thermoanaerobaculaceae bacterium]HRS16494.1 DinB family protein [Thermoanaerobaculaceae bacterium]